VAVSDSASDRQALDFLEKGKRSKVSVEDLASACDRVVRSETQRSSERALQLGKAYVRRAKDIGGLLYTSALRSYGWANLVAGQYREAEKAYARARELLRRQPELRARVDRVLVDIYMYLGRFNSARARARAALRTFDKLGLEVEAAKTRVNFANLLHRQDRHSEARELYLQSATVLQRHGENLPLALCWYNLANTETQLFDFEEARHLYSRAETIFRDLGHTLHATSCRYGLAWLHMLEGNYHTALKDLAACEKQYRQGGHPREIILVQLDRAEAFLGLNLFTDSRNAAEQAERNALKLGIRYEAAKAAFFLGQALVGLGRKRDAVKALQRAEKGFQAEHNQPFLAASQLLKSELMPGKVAGSRIKAARRRFVKAQLPLWEAVCDLRLLSLQPERPAIYRRLAANPAVEAVPHLYARNQTALGDRAARGGRVDKAVEHWSSAAERLEVVRAKLPPVGLRTSFFRHQSDPYRKLVDACSETDPHSAAVWSERYKTAGLWSVKNALIPDDPTRLKAEQSLAELAARVTALSGRLAGQSGQRGPGVITADRHITRLQTEVRDNLASVDERTTAPDRFEVINQQIRSAARHQPVVQFHVGDRDIIAFVHHRDSTRIHRYPDGGERVDQFLGRWQFLAEQTPFESAKIGRREYADEQVLLGQIGEWLWRPLELERQPRLLVVPEGRLSNLPWFALSIGGHPLAEYHELVFAPSLRHFLHARRKSSRSERIEIFIGATEGLTRFDQDWQRLNSTPGRGAIVHQPATRSDWPNDAGARIWHFSGHADLRSDNPFYSSLQMADGPMFAADFRLKRNSVGLVALAACRTGQQTALPGEEASGLVRSLLEMGARNVIASHWAVSDEATAFWMDRFYKEYLEGSSAASAVRSVTLHAMEKYVRAYYWSAFSVFGAG
jgi:tetratricopeptide (TPR) repeat protein